MNLNIIIPDSFLCEENRCDYVITKEIKKLWAVELDLLAEFDRVCKKHNLHYLAVGGTLLGAARHKGYIPWDDDIDLAMFRDDYDILCKVGPQEFSYPYCFQTPYVPVEERPFLSDMFRIRNSGTTAIDSMQKKYSPNSNQGIFIDVFPLDNVPDDDRLKKKQLQRIKKYNSLVKNCFFCTKSHLWSHPNYVIRTVRRIIAFCLDGTMKVLTDRYFKKYVDECKKYNNQITKKVGQLMFVSDAEKLIFEREDCENTVDSQFEFMTIPIGVGFDRMLKYQFGDWHKMVRGTAYHSLDVINADVPYKDYCRD